MFGSGIVYFCTASRLWRVGVRIQLSASMASLRAVGHRRAETADEAPRGDLVKVDGTGWHAREVFLAKNNCRYGCKCMILLGFEKGLHRYC